MLSHRLFAATLVLFLGFTTSSFAQTAPQPGQLRIPDITHVPLDMTKIQNLIKSMPAMKEFGQKHKMNKLPKGGPGDPNAALMTYLKANNLTGELKGMLGKYGFSSIQEWSQAMQSMTIAYGFAKSGQSPEQMKNEMQKMINKLQADPNMPQDQKAGLIGMFKQQMSIALKMAPPPGNIAAVKKMMPQIEQAMGQK